MPGFFLTIEGIEGTGKSTIAERTEHWFREKGHSVYRTREPGGTPVGESLRKILLDASHSLCLESELLLMEAARAQLMDEFILPKLASGYTVVLDRHIDSTTAYQGYGRGMDLDLIVKLNRFTCRGRVPDLTLLLDVNVQTGLERAKKITDQENLQDRFESERVEFMQLVRDGFLEIARREPNRISVVSTEEGIEKVWKKIQTLLHRCL